MPPRPCTRPCTSKHSVISMSVSRHLPWARMRLKYSLKATVLFVLALGTSAGAQNRSQNRQPFAQVLQDRCDLQTLVRRQYHPQLADGRVNICAKTPERLPWIRPYAGLSKTIICKIDYKLPDLPEMAGTVAFRQILCSCRKLSKTITQRRVANDPVCWSLVERLR